MADEKISAHVEENGQSPYAVTIQVSGHELHGDEPVSFGGGNSGPAPYDMLLASLGECTSMTVRWYAKQQNWPLEKVEVNLTHFKENRTDSRLSFMATASPTISAKSFRRSQLNAPFSARWKERRLSERLGRRADQDRRMDRWLKGMLFPGNFDANTSSVTWFFASPVTVVFFLRNAFSSLFPS